MVWGKTKMSNYTNSPLTNVTVITNKSNPRDRDITKITIHHVAGIISAFNLGNFFKTTTRQVSSNYGIGNDGQIGQYVEEKNRAWTSSNKANDMAAVTIEVSNSSTGGSWPVSEKALNSLIKLCADICKRNGIKKLFYDGTTKGTLTLHEMFANTNCPGAYLKGKLTYICGEVNKTLGNTGGCSTTPPVTHQPPSNDTYEVKVNLKGYITAADAIADKNAKVTVAPGNYFVFNKVSGAINVTKTKGSPGAWINPNKNVTNTNPPVSAEIKIGDTVILNGQIFGDSTGNRPGRIISNMRTKVTRYAKGAKYPYNTTGDLGWVAASSLKKV